MYAKEIVKIPEEKGKIIRKKIKGATYIYYQIDRSYDKEKGYSIPKCIGIGKACEDDLNMMYPNEKYLVYCADAKLPERKASKNRSACLRIGAYIVLKKIIKDYKLDTMLSKLIERYSGLFLDLAIYSIIAENNASQYYPDYAFNHPLFTKKMRMYSDSKVSEFIATIDKGQSILFMNEWNKNRNHKEKVYISYDSTNKNCQAGDIDFAQMGHSKADKNKPVLNYAIAYDKNNSEPLFYEMYPGSIVDVSQLQYMIEKTAGYGYKNVGFVLDRGYFAKENIRYMDHCGYEFIIMMRGMKKFAANIIKEQIGSFENDRKYRIRDYRVNGTTVKGYLFPSDEKERYFHIYYNERKSTVGKEHLHDKLDLFSDFLERQQGVKGYECPSALNRYFDAKYYIKDNEKTFLFARERSDVINEEMKLYGYFIIITSEKMNAEEALDLYKSRDGSEKLFRGDKSYLGNKSFRVHGNESVTNKIFMEFVALIVRNKFFTYLREEMKRNRKRPNFMSVPAALKELEKIEMIRQVDGNYRMDHAVTATQKKILKAFGMNERNIREEAIEINKQLQKLNEEES